MGSVASHVGTCCIENHAVPRNKWISTLVLPARRCGNLGSTDDALVIASCFSACHGPVTSLPESLPYLDRLGRTFKPVKAFAEINRFLS